MTRGAKQNENRFLNDQQSGIRNRKKKIKKIILNLNKSQVHFENPTRLAKFISETINSELKEIAKSHENEMKSMALEGKVEAKKTKLKRNEGRIVHTTLLRSEHYRPMIDQYFLKDKRKISDNISSEKTLILELENTELKSNIKALNNYIANQDAKFLTDKTVKTSKNMSIYEEKTAFSLDACYKVIMNLIEESDCVFIFDDGQIKNSAKSINDVVASKDLMKKSGLFESQLFGKNNEE
jgi:hypothetical protein